MRSGLGDERHKLNEARKSACFEYERTKRDIKRRDKIRGERIRVWSWIYNNDTTRRRGLRTRPSKQSDQERTDGQQTSRISRAFIRTFVTLCSFSTFALSISTHLLLLLLQLLLLFYTHAHMLAPWRLHLVSTTLSYWISRFQQCFETKSLIRLSCLFQTLVSIRIVFWGGFRCFSCKAFRKCIIPIGRRICLPVSVIQIRGKKTLGSGY